MAAYSGEDVEKGDHSSNAGWSDISDSHFENQYGNSLAKWESV